MEADVDDAGAKELAAADGPALPVSESEGETGEGARRTRSKAKTATGQNAQNGQK
jgi:hypothetical protein